MPLSSNRTLLRALAASLLLHALLLGSTARLSPELLAVPENTLSTLIVVARRGDSSPAPGASVTKAPSTAARPLSGFAESQVALAAPVAVVEAPEKFAPRESAAASAAGPAVRSGEALVTRSPAPPAPTPAGTRVSADDLRQYRLSLASAAKRFKHYPALASERGWEGTVEVAINVSALSPLPQVLLVRSSGRSVLDAQAVDMLTQAAHATALPEGLKARDFRILLPVEFSLENDH
jgi:protein TonB